MADMGHAIWRQCVIEHLNRRDRNGLHYSAIHCLSKADLEAVMATLKATVLGCRKIIDDSPPETLGVLCLDWFER
jgi:hypothetical protein